MSRLPALITTGVLAAALGAGALGVAAAASPAPSGSGSNPSASTPASASKHPKPAKHAKGLERRVAHGEFVVREKGTFRTIALQRGQITAVSATSISLKSADGYTRSYVINTSTKLGSKAKPQVVGELKVGEQGVVRAVIDGGTYTAVHIGTHQGGKKPAPAASSTG